MGADILLWRRSEPPTRFQVDTTRLGHATLPVTAVGHEGNVKLMARSLHLFCWHESARDQDSDSARLREMVILAGQYRLGVETQMHFNQLILRTRTLGMYGAILVMGSALLLRSQYPDSTPFQLAWGQFLVQLSGPALIALFGPVLLVIVYLMDRHYYLRLLYGINRYVYGIERSARKEGLKLAGISDAFRQGLDIQEAFGPRAGASTRFVKACYSLVALTEVLVIWFLVANQ